MSVRRWLQIVFASTLYRSGAIRYAKRRLRERGAVVVLMFHRVLGDAELKRTYSQRSIIVQTETFRLLTEHVSANFEPVRADEPPGARTRRLRVSFTFDDGWADNLTNALPIAKQANVPLSIFVCPGLDGRQLPFWPERLAALANPLRDPAKVSATDQMIEEVKGYTPLKREQFLSTIAKGNPAADVDPHCPDRTLTRAEIVNMSANGVTFGSHTVSHEILTSCSQETARAEVLESQFMLSGLLNARCDLFAYPSGRYSDEVVRCVAAAGYRFAFATDPGAWTGDLNSLKIPRMNVYEDNVVGLDGKFSPAMFEYTTIWKAWRASQNRQKPQNDPPHYIDQRPSTPRARPESRRKSNSAGRYAQ